jgi:hypothetical protein
MSYLKMSASMAPHLLTLTQTLVHELAGGKRELTEQGIRQVPLKPLPPRIIKEDDGTIRENGWMMRYYTEEQLNAKLGINPIVVDRPMRDWQVPEGFDSAKDEASDDGSL